MRNFAFSIFTFIATFSQSAYSSDAVSMFQILGDPKAWDQKHVVVEGVLGFIGKDTVALYVDAGSRDAQITINSFLITTMLEDRKIGAFGREDLKKMEGKYVVVWGEFFFGTPRNETFSGSLGKITAIGAVPKFPEFSTPAPSEEKK